MALTIVDSVVACASRVVTTVLAANTERKGAAMQNQSGLDGTPGRGIRMRHGNDPTAEVGWSIMPGTTFPLGLAVPAQGNQTDFYTGDVRVYNPSAEPVNVYVIESD